jgi:broad specificity phosphatase PhoE
LSTEYGNIEEIVKKIASLNPDIIYSSPMQRCLYLAKRFSSITHGTVVIENRLLERDFGQLEGKPVVINDKQIIGDFDLNSDLNQGVEKIQDMYFKRIKPFLDEVCKSKNKQILIVSHS